MQSDFIKENLHSQISLRFVRISTILIGTARGTALFSASLGITWHPLIMYFEPRHTFAGTNIGTLFNSHPSVEYTTARGMYKYVELIYFNFRSALIFLWGWARREREFVGAHATFRIIIYLSGLCRIFYWILIGVAFHFIGNPPEIRICYFEEVMRLNVGNQIK